MSSLLSFESLPREDLDTEFAYKALGRTADPKIVNSEAGDDSYVSSSPTPMEAGGPVPRALTEEEIQRFVDDYVQAGKNAMEAGFDGVEIHGANVSTFCSVPTFSLFHGNPTDIPSQGYLIDQFTQSTCNTRTDRWGGSIPNRSRFALTIASSLVSALGASKVGMRLSPFSDFQGMKVGFFGRFPSAFDLLLN